MSHPLDKSGEARQRPVESHPRGVGRGPEGRADLLEGLPRPQSTCNDVVAGIVEQFEGNTYEGRLFSLMGCEARSIAALFSTCRGDVALPWPDHLPLHRTTLGAVVIVAATNGVLDDTNQ